MLRQIVHAVMEADLGHRHGLPRAQHRTGLDKRYFRRKSERRHGAQRIGRQRSTSRAKFDIAAIGRLLRTHPEIGNPQADEFAEHLADFRRRDKVAICSKGVGRGIIDGVCAPHIVRHADGAGSLDLPP